MATRFCPSPTGFLHIGNVRTALFNYLLARRNDMPFLLRLEDTDRQRCRPEYEQAIVRDLAWLGLHTQGEVWRQSERKEIYAQYADRLRIAGHIYPCFCADTALKVQRKTALAAGRAPRYDGTCRRLSADQRQQRLADGQPHAWRFQVAEGQSKSLQDMLFGNWQMQTGLIGDFVIIRRDSEPTFLFCNALDDALSGVQLAVRGEDHMSNTPRQLMILEALALPVPTYGHLSLLKGRDGKPLSKRDGGSSIQSLRQQGYLPGALLNQVFRLGHSITAKGLLDLDAMVAELNLEAISRSAALWTADDLKHWQKLAVEGAARADLVAWLAPDMGPLPDRVSPEAVAEFLRPNLLLPEEAAPWPDRLFSDNLTYSPEAVQTLTEAGEAFFRTCLQCWPAENAQWPGFTAALGQATGHKGRRLFLPLRVALSGQPQGPELDAMASLMGEQRVAGRFAQVAQLLAAAR